MFLLTELINAVIQEVRDHKSFLSILEDLQSESRILLAFQAYSIPIVQNKMSSI
jgi:hypothetical protein